MDFNEFRFAGLDYKVAGKRHWSMRRVAEGGGRILVDVAPEQLFQTMYGYALILDRTHVAFVKDWCVLDGEWGSVLVLLDQRYFVPKEFGEHDGYGDDPDNLEWRAWLAAATAQAEEQGERVFVKRS